MGGRQVRILPDEKHSAPQVYPRNQVHFDLSHGETSFRKSLEPECGLKKQLPRVAPPEHTGTDCAARQSTHDMFTLFLIPPVLSDTGVL